MSTEHASYTAEFPTPIDFVVRHQEMSGLRSALAEAFSGRAQLVMLAREPGRCKINCYLNLGARQFLGRHK